jgi:protein gp37
VADKTGIEWTDATWNPVTGCDEVSPGCDHCYARTVAERFGAPAFPNGFGVTLRPHKMDQPLRWTRPRRIFVNSMSDLFHAEIPDDYIAQVFAVMALAPRHTFQLLTKRHGRMRSLLSNTGFTAMVRAATHELANEHRLDWPESRPSGWEWPLRNVWLGVSVEDQRWADLRIPVLLATPAARRFISAEPLLGLVSLQRWISPGCTCPAIGNPWFSHAPTCPIRTGITGSGALDWVIVGGESGRGARPMHPVWARNLRDQCATAGIPFLFKQGGEWAPVADEVRDTDILLHPSGDRMASQQVRQMYPEIVAGVTPMRRVGKKRAGRVLDGTTHDGYPPP